jgi:hypothetical protein
MTTMEQILFLYFIRVITTILGGYYLSSVYVSTKIPQMAGFSTLLHASRSFKGILGLISLLVGIVSLFTGYFIGDLFPSILNIGVGLILLYEYQDIAVNENEHKIMAFFKTWIVEKQLYWGFASLFFGFLHLFFAKVPLI